MRNAARTIIKFNLLNNNLKRIKQNRKQPYRQRTFDHIPNVAHRLLNIPDRQPTVDQEVTVNFKYFN